MFLFGKKESMAARGERLAARHLRRNGYRVLERNVRLAGCEIDIIAEEGDTIAFVEVKTREGDPHLQPEDSVGYTKQRHIRRAAHRYIADHPDPNRYYRYDVVSVILPPQGKTDITLYRNAFTDD